MRVLIAAGLVALGLTGAQTQTPPRDQARWTSTGTAVITGTVVADDETRAPLRHAVVTLTHTTVEDIRTVTTDEQGQFVFDTLPAGSFRLAASKGGYLTMSYGAPQPGGMPGRVITLAAGQRFSTGAIAIMHGAVIAGRLTDRYGRPIANTGVTANRFVMVGGERRPRNTEGSSRSSVTNAHGDYRIHGLMPGEYIVYAVPSGRTGGAASETTAAEVAWVTRLASQAAPAGQVPPTGRAFSYAPTIFPGTTDASAATPIVLARGEERLGSDFSLLYVPISRVAGIVTLPDGRPADGVTVLTGPRQIGLFADASMFPTRTGPDGRFVVDGLSPGAYSVVARGAPVAQMPWGRAEVDLSGQDRVEVAIQMQLGLRVSGSLVATSLGGAPPPDVTRVRMSLISGSRDISLGTNIWSATVAADGTFKFEGVMPGSVRLAATVPPVSGGATTPWSVRSAVAGGKDVTDLTFEVTADLSNLVVTLADAQTQVAGALIDGSGRPVPDLYVLMFPTDKALWSSGTRRIKSARALENGTYTIDALPVGEYYLCALTELDPMLINEPIYLEQLVPSAVKLTLAEGEKKKQDLQVGR
jgi:protocatechuate 3,4-dioxygenase beta subunit